MRDNLRRVGRMIRAAEQAGPGAAEVVQTVTSPAAGWVQVDSAGAIYPARVPGSLRKTVTAGQTVRVSKSGSVRTVTEIITDLPAPAVSNVPGQSNVDPEVNTTVSDGCYDWSDGSGSPRDVYNRDIAAYTRGLAGDINEIRDDLDVAAGDIVRLRNTVNALRTTVEQLRAALADQGHIS